MDSGPHYCLKVTVYEMTCKGRQPLPVRLWMVKNVKHIMRGDLDIVTIQILDHISSITFVGPRLGGPGLLREEARACQEGFMHYMDWQGLNTEWEIHPLTLEEGTAEIDHCCQEIHGNYIPFKLPMGLSVSPVTYLDHCQRLLRSSSSERSQRSPPQDRNNSAYTRQMYVSPRQRRHQHAHGSSPGGDPDPSNSEWESTSMVSETSMVSGRQRGEGTYDPKMDRKTFFPKLTDDSTEEAVGCGELMHWP